MEMKTLLIIAGVLIVVFILKACTPNNNSKNKNRSIKAEVPTEKTTNDKVVLIENVKLEDLKNALQQFCNNYNQEKSRALPLLTILSENKFVITFPYDTDFTTYCFFYSTFFFQTFRYICKHQ